MAIIRLPQTQAIADAPKPVLDNNARPTVNNRAVASAVNDLAQAQRAPEAPMSLAVNGYEAVGRAIQQTGSVLGALHKEKQEAITRKQIGDADAGIAAEKMRHESWKESTQADPMKWEERRAAAMQSFREKTLADESLTGEARQQIITRLDREDGVWKAEDELRGAKKIFGDVHDMYAADIKRAAIEQDRARWEELRKAGGKYFQEVQKLGQEEEFKSIGERNALKAKADALDAAENEVVTIASGNGEADALAYVDAMPFDETKKEALRNVAKRVSASRQGEAQDQILDGIASGDFRTPEAIDAAVHDNPHFTPRVVEMLKSHVVKMQNAEVRAQMNAPDAIARSQAELSAKVREYDRAADKDGLQAAQLKSEIAMRLKDDDAGYLKQSLWAKFNQSEAKGDLPSSKAILNDAIGSVFDSSWKGLPLEWVDKDGKRHKTYDDPQKRGEAIDAEYRVRLKYNEWERQNPDAAKDPEKIRAKVMQLIPEAKKINVLNGLPPLPDIQKSAGGTLPESAVNMVKKLESFIPKAYGDYKQTSVGYGTRARFSGETLTQSEADARLREELSMHAARVDGSSRKVGLNLSEAQRASLISFDFNTGEGSQLIESSGGNMSEIKRRLLLYTNAGGKRSEGLVNRRRQEAAML